MIATTAANTGVKGRELAWAFMIDLAEEKIVRGTVPLLIELCDEGAIKRAIPLWHHGSGRERAIH